MMALLNREKQNNTFRFRGQAQNGKPPKGEDFDPEFYLSSLNELDFKVLFYEWVAQCWIYDNTELVPTEQEQLEKFDMHSLIPEFKKKYIEGDWKFVTEGSGASIDEMYLFDQMLFRQTVTFLLNKDQAPPSVLPQMARYYFIPEEVIFPIVLEFINYPPAIALITDGADHHVFNPIFFDKEREMIQYEDNIGANGKCFLSKGNNALGIDSRFIGYSNLKNWCWEISVEEFKTVFYGMVVLRDRHDLWNSLAFSLAKF